MTNVDSDTGVLAGEQRMLIDGELRYTDSGALFDVVHPASEQVAGQATDGTVTDVERATTAARRAFDTTDWSRDVDFRHHCLRQLQEALTAEQERLRRIVITEVGCPVSVTGSQIESPIAEVGHWAEHGRAFDYLVDTGVHETPLGPARRKIQYDPVGVVGAITPWNVPFYLNIAETVPALMAGNTVVLKPAQLTPWSGTEYARIVAEETDIPAGEFNVVVGDANEVGAALSADPRVDMITFTGSTATGRAILAAGAPTVKKTLLELGGKSAHIVLDDADFNSALPIAASTGLARSTTAASPPAPVAPASSAGTPTVPVSRAGPNSVADATTQPVASRPPVAPSTTSTAGVLRRQTPWSPPPGSLPPGYHHDGCRCIQCEAEDEERAFAAAEAELEERAVQGSAVRGKHSRDSSSSGLPSGRSRQPSPSLST